MLHQTLPIRRRNYFLALVQAAQINTSSSVAFDTISNMHVAFLLFLCHLSYYDL